MAWGTTTAGYPWSGSVYLTSAIQNAIVADIRTWGGNVDGGGYALANLSGLSGVAGILDVTSARFRISTVDSHTSYAAAAGQEHLVLRNTDGTTNNWMEMAFYSAAGVIGSGIGIQNVNPGSNYQALALFTRGSGGFLERVRVTEEGKVGVATNAPLTTVHIAGVSTVPASELGTLLVCGGSSSYRVAIGYDSALDHGWIQSVHNGVSSTPLLLNPNGGNVGIATSAPTSALQVVGLPSYASNALALAGGLTAGAFYRNGDVVQVVH